MSAVRNDIDGWILVTTIPDNLKVASSTQQSQPHAQAVEGGAGRIDIRRAVLGTTL
jgi:hypothetical protein